ncbi:hypothetical protein DUNSADRAFT_1545, partial [Dunaliella salina]
LSKACHEKNYFAARALAAERTIADQLHFHCCLDDPDKRVCRELRALKTLEVDTDKDVSLYKAKDQSVAEEPDDASLLPSLQKPPQQQQRQGRYARPGSSASSKQACPQVPTASAVASVTDAAIQVHPEPATPTVVVSSNAQQSNADVQTDTKAAAMAAELEAQLAKARANLGVAQENITALEQESRRLECALQSEQKAAQASAAEVGTLKQEVAVIKGVSDETANQAASLMQALGEAQAHNAKLLADLATKEDLVVLLTQQLGDLQAAAGTQPTSAPRAPQPPLNLPSSAPAEQHDHSPVQQHDHSPELQHDHSPVQQHGHNPMQQHGNSPVTGPYSAQQHDHSPVQRHAGACPRQRLLCDEQGTPCSWQAASEQAMMHRSKDGDQTLCDGGRVPRAVTGTQSHECAEGPGVAASLQDLPVPQPLTSSSPCKQDGADSPASSSSTVTAQYGASGLLFGGEESKEDGVESAPHQGSCQEYAINGQKKPQQLSLHCSSSSSSARSNNSSVAPSTPAASTPGRLMRTSANMTPKTRLELQQKQQQQQQQQQLDREALEESKRRLSRTPPKARVVSNGVNWGRGGSIEAFGEGGTTVMSIVQRFR